MIYELGYFFLVIVFLVGILTDDEFRESMTCVIMTVVILLVVIGRLFFPG